MTTEETLAAIRSDLFAPTAFPADDDGFRWPEPDPVAAEIRGYTDATEPVTDQEWARIQAERAMDEAVRERAVKHGEG